MRRAVVLAGLLAGCKLHSLASVVSFEGEVDMSVSSIAFGRVATTLKMEMKGDKTRVETSLAGFSSVTLTDASAKKVWTLEPTTRTYTETDLSATTAAAKATMPKMSVRKTGRSDKVAGYDCDVYEVDDPSGALSHSELCLASGFSALALGLAGPFAAFAQADSFGDVLSHGFPLRMVVRDSKGAPLVTMEATRIERRKIPDSDLEIPPGFTKSR